MINVENVYKRFDEVEALKGVTLKIQRGSIFGIAGRNGAGKTTLLKILTGVYKQDSGTVSIESKSVFENPQVKSKIFLYQTIHTFLEAFQFMIWQIFIKEL